MEGKSFSEYIVTNNHSLVKNYMGSCTTGSTGMANKSTYMYNDWYPGLFYLCNQL